jgi:hypothetical protein
MVIALSGNAGRFRLAATAGIMTARSSPSAVMDSRRHVTSALDRPFGVGLQKDRTDQACDRCFVREYPDDVRADDR